MRIRFGYVVDVSDEQRGVIAAVRDALAWSVSA